jgi:2-phosphosulfolactate phosphatase
VVIQVDLELRARDAGKAVGRGDLIIVIDVLRSGTSILNALTNGAQAAVPATTLEEAYKLHSKHPQYLLAGERGGHKPVGFDLGNSPLEFTSERVEGKILVITTTSGTAALVRSKAAKWVLVGGFLNALAAARKAEKIAAREIIGVSFVLAGEKGKFSLEDFLCAGAIANGFAVDKVHFSDKVQAALLAFKQAENDLTGNVMKAKHAEHLVQLGFKGDVDFSCSLNVFRTVPMYADGKITLHWQTAPSSL